MQCYNNCDTLSRFWVLREEVVAPLIDREIWETDKDADSLIVPPPRFVLPLVPDRTQVVKRVRHSCYNSNQ